MTGLRRNLFNFNNAAMLLLLNLNRRHAWLIHDNSFFAKIYCLAPHLWPLTTYMLRCALHCLARSSQEHIIIGKCCFKFTPWWLAGTVARVYVASQWYCSNTVYVLHGFHIIACWQVTIKHSYLLVCCVAGCWLLRSVSLEYAFMLRLQCHGSIKPHSHRGHWCKCKKFKTSSQSLSHASHSHFKLYSH